MIQCPDCRSTDIKRIRAKNGLTHYGKQNHKCKRCHRQLVLDPQTVSDEKRALVKRLLLERISRRGIARVLQIRMTWLMNSVRSFYGDRPNDSGVEWAKEAQPQGGRLLVRCFDCETDEQWSFVGSKPQQAWLWVALDVKTRQVVASHVGGREDRDAVELWLKLPKRYRLQARFYTDGLQAYDRVVPGYLHEPSRGEGKTNHVERLFCRLRQRLSRLVRKGPRVLEEVGASCGGDPALPVSLQPADRPSTGCGCRSLTQPYLLHTTSVRQGSLA